MSESATSETTPAAGAAPAGSVNATGPARSRLPRGVRMLIGGVVGSAVVTAALLWETAARDAGIGRPATVALFTVLVLVSWLFPLIMHRGSESEAVHPDEAAFVVAAILLPPLGVLAVFTIAVAASHILRPRAWVKALFNCGQLVTAVGAGALALTLVAGGAQVASTRRIAAALIGATVFFAVNSLSMALLMQTMGFKSLRTSFLDGAGIRIRIAGGGVVLAVFVAVAAAAQPWILLCGFLPFLILRQVLTGHFQARHDRSRLEGLLRATIEAHGSMGGDGAARAIEQAAVELLRSDRAAITGDRPAPGALAAPIDREGPPLWLVVEGRKKAEPLESADLAVLETLAAVAAGALTNAALYQQVQHQRERLDAITSCLGEGVCALDRLGVITFANPAAAALLGWEDGIPTQAPFFLLDPARRSIEANATIRSDDGMFERPDGSALPVAFTCSPVIAGLDVTGAVIAFQDTTERKVFEEQLAHHAFNDTLTGLANRRVFLDRLDHAMARSERRDEINAVLFIDVDRFKTVNDNLGHHAGDALLVALAKRLESVVRAGETLARFGGDEFTLLLEGISGVSAAVTVAERIAEELREPIPVTDDHEVFATVSIGIAVTTGRATRDDVLHDADVAMYQAKSKGPGHVEVFDAAAMHARSAERLDLEAALRRAIDRGEIEVHFQPVFEASGSPIVGSEALVRWNHPRRGVISPSEFVPLAEESGLILSIGRFVLERACQQARIWRDEFGPGLTTSINLSARQFQHPGLSEEIGHIIERAGVDPASICLEITESVAMTDADRTIAILHQLKSLGVLLAIDDFGTGYSSLGYLKRFPVDIVKVDRSFVAGIGVNAVDEAIVAAVVNLAHAVGMKTVAEGVETIEQLEHLRELGCTAVQGFYFARPAAADEVTRQLDAQRPDGPRHLRVVRDAG